MPILLGFNEDISKGNEDPTSAYERELEKMFLKNKKLVEKKLEARLTASSFH